MDLNKKEKVNSVKFIDAHCHLESFKSLDFLESKVNENDIFPISTGYSHDSNLKTVNICDKFKLPYVLGIAPQTVLSEKNYDLLIRSPQPKGSGFRTEEQVYANSVLPPTTKNNRFRFELKIVQDTPRTYRRSRFPHRISHDVEKWIDFIKSKSPIAIGEIGLDFHYGKSSEDLKNEKKLFNKMLDLSDEINLPVVIHSRKAEREVFEILKERNKKDFMMHFYDGDYSLSQEIVDFGGIISIPPLHSKRRKRVIKETPLKNLVVETDAPYVAKTIEDVKNSIEYISSVKNVDFESVRKSTIENSLKFFKLGGLYGFN